MKTTNNFINIVAIGHFNPAILTPTFLITKCDFPKDKELIKRQTLPVVSKLDYNDISFITELDRFQISENNVENADDIKIINYFINYFSVLKYTPINIAGINFNYNISEYSESIFETLNDIDIINDFCAADNLIFHNRTIIKGKVRKSTFWEITYLVNDGYKIQYKIERDNSNIKVNCNYEIGDIKGISVEEIVIVKKFSEIVGNCKQLLSFIAKGA